MGIVLQSVPIGSLSQLETKDRDHYINIVTNMPPSTRKFLFDANTGAFLRGLVKSYNEPESRTPIVAFLILRITTGEIPLEDLSKKIADQLPTNNETANRMASEIINDLFHPLLKDLEKYWQSIPHNKTTYSQKTFLQANNLLNLKEKSKPPAPPPMPSSS